MVFTRRDPQRYVLLYARLGPEGADPRTQHFKPAGADYAGPEEVMELGYVPEKWRDLAFFAIHCLSLVASEEEFDEKFIPALKSRFGEGVVSEDFWDRLHREATRLDVLSAEQRGVAVVKAEDSA
jgi:hypothetical protein